MLAKKDVLELGSLTPKVIIQLDTPLGYMQLLEYTMQDCSYVHVLQWYFCNILLENTNFPKHNCETFYRNKNIAIERAYSVGNDLLKCY